MKKVVTVLGARPQFIKASIVSRTIQASNDLREVLVHTGQHFDANMSEVFFAELGMNKPDYFLDIHGGGHGLMTGRMLERIEELLLHEKPDAVLVYGDTNSTLAGALAAAKLNIRVAHVEAGLRSFNMSMPEEINRIITDRLSHWLFTPTAAARTNLLREGIDPVKIEEVGDVMYDVALNYGDRVHLGGNLLEQLGLITGKYVLATVHRAENTDAVDRLTAILNGLIAIAEQIPVVWPLHPRTRAALERIGILHHLPLTLHLIDPVGYLVMVQLEKHAAVIATDSGGIQKEAFFYKVPCIILRDETEWIELVEAGWNLLVPPDNSIAITNAVLGSVGRKGKNVFPYGLGDAAQRIVTGLIRDLA